jgi:hypothetical protein
MFKNNSIDLHLKKNRNIKSEWKKGKNNRDRSGRSGRVTQVEECLPTKHEALTSNPSSSKKGRAICLDLDQAGS